MATLFCTIVRVQSLYAGTGLQPLAARALKNSLEKKISQTLNVFYIGIFAYVYHKKKGKCRWIYHTLSVWVFFLFGCFGKRHRHVVFLAELQNVSFNFLILEETNVYKIITIFIYRISFYKHISLSLFLNLNIIIYYICITFHVLATPSILFDALMVLGGSFLPFPIWSLQRPPRWWCDHQRASRS